MPMKSPSQLIRDFYISKGYKGRELDEKCISAAHHISAAKSGFISRSEAIANVEFGALLTQAQAPTPTPASPAKNKPLARKSGFPYATKLSPVSPAPARRYRNVASLAQLNELLE